MKLPAPMLAALLALTTWLSGPSEAAELRAAPADFVVASAELPPLPAGWVEVAGPAFVVHGPANELPLLQTLSAHGNEALPRIAKSLGTAIGGTIRVVVTPSDDAFRRLQPGTPPTWADATAWPSLGLVYLRSPRARGGMAKPIEQVLDHELVHILLGRAFAPAHPPAWLQEGVAQVLAGEAGPENTARLARGLRGAAIIPLEDLERGFPVDAHRAELAYAESADFVAWLQVEHGPETIARLVRATRDGDTLAAAVRRVSGVPLMAIDARWQERLSSHWLSWSAPGSLEGALWGLAGVGILIVGAARRSDRSVRLGAWREQETALGRLAREVLALRRSPTA